MRLVVWNCNGGLHAKLDALERLRPDVAVISESDSPEIVRVKSNDRLPESVVWIGEEGKKGLAVIGWGPWRVRADDDYDRSLRYLAPVHVDGPTPFRILAVWARHDRLGDHDERGFGPLLRGLDRYDRFLSVGPVIVAGDFNNNVTLKPKKPGNRHEYSVTALAKRGLFSTYHHQRGVDQGREPEPTIYWRNRSADGPRYHIDYIFASEHWKQGLKGVEVGSFAEWVANGLSDHVPLIADFDTDGVLDNVEDGA